MSDVQWPKVRILNLETGIQILNVIAKLIVIATHQSQVFNIIAAARMNRQNVINFRFKLTEEALVSTDFKD